MKNNPSLQEKSAIGMLVAGVVIALIALLVPPLGQIHESVCWIFAQCLIYAGSVFGVASYLEHLRRRLLLDPPDAPLPDTRSTASSTVPSTAAGAAHDVVPNPGVRFTVASAVPSVVPDSVARSAVPSDSPRDFPAHR